MPELGKFYPDNLIAGPMQIDTIDITVIAGVTIKRGYVLGRITRSVPATGTADGANTGDGTITEVEARRYTKQGSYIITCITAATAGGELSVVEPDGSNLGTARVGSFAGTGDGTITGVKAGKMFKNTGYYSVKCTAAITNSGTFEVTDPDGVAIGTFTIPAGAGNSYQFIHEQITLTVTDGATDFVLDDEFLVSPFEHDQIAFLAMAGAADFVVGDFFTIAVTVGSRECKLVDSALSDGAETPYCVASEDIDTTITGTNAATKSVGYRSGQFNERSLVVGGDDDISDHIDALRSIGIYSNPSVPAGDF